MIESVNYLIDKEVNGRIRKLLIVLFTREKELQVHRDLRLHVGCNQGSSSGCQFGQKETSSVNERMFLINCFSGYESSDMTGFNYSI